MALSQKQVLKKGLSLAPQQLIEQNLLPLSGTELIEHIQKEIEENPALEEAPSNNESQEPQEEKITEYEVNNDGEYEERAPQKEYSPEVGYIDAISSERTLSLYEVLATQVPQMKLTPNQSTIAHLIIGNLDENGYLMGECSSISDQLKFEENKDITVKEVEEVLQRIQQLDPPGIGARNIQESLQIQINRNTKEKKKTRQIAKKIVTSYLDLLSSKNTKELCKKFKEEQKDVLRAIQFIRHLNPNPGEALLQSNAENKIHINPDFSITTEGDLVKVSLHEKYTPSLHINKQFFSINQHTLSPQEKKETTTFIAQHVQRASFFLQALQMRKETLERIIHAVAKIQKPYFINGDEELIAPMLLKDVALIAKRDISTISRAVANKYVATNWEVTPLRRFFNQQVKHQLDSTKTKYNIQNEIKEVIEKEDNTSPYTDQEIANKLQEKGYSLSRRSIISYRKKMNLPPSNRRKRNY